MRWEPGSLTTAWTEYRCPGVSISWALIPTVILLALPAADTLAAEPTSTEPGRPAESASGTDLRNLIEQVGAKSNKHFVIDPRVRGSVDPGALPQPLTYHMLLEVLGVHGFVAIPSGDVIKVIPDSMARTVATPMVSANDIKGDDAEVVTVLIPLKDGNAEKQQFLLRPLVPQWGLASATPDQNSLLVVDRVANVKRLIAVIRAQELGK